MSSEGSGFPKAGLKRSGGRGGPTLGIEMGSCLQVSQILSYHQLSYLGLIDLDILVCWPDETRLVFWYQMCHSLCLYFAGAPPSWEDGNLPSF